MNLFVLDPHTIYRRGPAACLALIDEVESVALADSVREAREDNSVVTKLNARSHSQAVAYAVREGLI